MELRAGYKETDVGVIPEDWVVNSIRELVDRVRLGGNYPNIERETSRPLIKMGNMGRGNISTTKMEYIPEAFPVEEQHLLEGGDVIFNTRNTLDLVGKVCIWRNELPVAYYNSNVLRLEFSSEKIASSYFANYALNSHKSILGLREIATGTTSVAAIYTRDFLEFRIATPPPSEQRAIAAALSDADALIASLDALIAKKRDLKHAAMQQLLTGKTRLPGFTGIWDETTFANLVSHHAGNSSLIKGKLPSREARDLFPGFSASGQDVWCKHYEHEGQAIVVSAVGSRCGKSFIASGKWCAIANTHVVWPISERVSLGFLMCFLNDEDFWLKSGSGQPFVLFRQTFQRSIALPKLDEQVAIATVLGDMDAELAALEAQREKVRALKQGMMQELLTGRIRLV